MPLISVSLVCGLLLSGFLAQMLGIRSVFLACAGMLAVIYVAGHFLMRGRTPHAATADVGRDVTAQSSAANQ
jgi:predicted MFS family arabinose efflux permease